MSSFDILKGHTITDVQGGEGYEPVDLLLDNGQRIRIDSYAGCEVIAPEQHAQEQAERDEDARQAEWDRQNPMHNRPLTYSQWTTQQAMFEAWNDMHHDLSRQFHG